VIETFIANVFISIAFLVLRRNSLGKRQGRQLRRERDLRGQCEC